MFDTRWFIIFGRPKTGSMAFRTLICSCVALLALLPAGAQSPRDPAEVSFITDIHGVPDAMVQADLRSSDAWREFLAAHPRWSVEFNESSGMPRMAFEIGRAHV